jgi:micrococcal nuclease
MAQTVSDCARLCCKNLLRLKPLRQLLPIGKQIAPRVADTARYSCSVAKVYKDNFSINSALVQEGQAVDYREYLNACLELKERLLKAVAALRRVYKNSLP